MPDNKLELIITAKDEASKALKSVGNTLKDLNKTVLKVATVGLAGLGAALAASIPLAFEEELALTNLRQTILSTGGAAGVLEKDAIALANAFERTTRFSDEQIISAEGLLLTFTKIGKDVFPDAIETTLNMAEKFGGLEASSIQLGKALNDPIAGVGALREVGVSFTEDQAEMIKKMVETGDIAGAQRVILDELAIEVGGLAEAYGSTNQGKVVRFKNKLVDLGQWVGGSIIGYVGELADKFTLLIDSFMEAGFWSAEFAEALGWLLGSNVGIAFWEIAQPMREIVNVLKEMGFAGVTTLQFWVSLNDIFGSSLGNQIREISVSFYEFWVTFKSFIDTALVPFIKEHSEVLIRAFTRLGALIGGGMLVAAITSLGTALVALLGPFALVAGAVVALSVAYDTNFMGLKTTVDRFVKWFIGTALPSIKNFIENDFIPNFEAFIALIKSVWETVKPELEKLLDWFVTSALPAIIDFITNDFIPALSDTIDWLIKVWTDVKPYLQEFALWFLDSALPDIISFVTNTAIPTIQSLIDTLINVWDMVRPKLVGLFNWVVSTGFPVVIAFITNTLIPTVRDVINAFSDIWNLAKPLLQQFYDWMLSTFASIKSSVIDPLVNGINSVINTAQSAINTINSLGNLSIPKLGIFGYADGGVAQGLFSTGERGQELVYAPQGAMVFPNDVTERLISQYNLTVHTSGDTTNIQNDFRMMEAFANG